MDRQKQILMRYSHLGLQFAVTIVICVFAGLWVDRRYSSRPWGVVGGVLVGFAVGFYHLLRSAHDMQREMDDSED